MLRETKALRVVMRVVVLVLVTVLIVLILRMLLAMASGVFGGFSIEFNGIVVLLDYAAFCRLSPYCQRLFEDLDVFARAIPWMFCLVFAYREVEGYVRED